MKYPLGTANGDAGEFFAAYKISKELGWPCRLFDIDIGIDAQVEILTDKLESTGRFVALQVKATSDEEVNCRYVSKRQLQYWRSLEIPVFVVLVNLQNEQMYLHLVEETREYEVTAKSGKYKIPFDLDASLFTPASAAIFAEASERAIMEHINVYLEQVKDATDRILRTVHNVRNDNPNPDDLIDDMEGRFELFGLLNQADAVSSVYKVGRAAITECRYELSWALYDLQEEMGPMEHDYSYRADISSFLSENYMSRPDDD